MSSIVASDGKVVADEMVDARCEALDRDEWPDGWVNVGEVVEGRLSTAVQSTEVLSVKAPSSMNRAVERRAKDEGISTSAYVRGVLAESLVASA